MRAGRLFTALLWLYVGGVFAFIFLLLSTTGAGAYSLDGLRQGKARLAAA